MNYCESIDAKVHMYNYCESIDAKAHLYEGPSKIIDLGSDFLHVQPSSF